MPGEAHCLDIAVFVTLQTKARMLGFVQEYNITCPEAQGMMQGTQATYHSCPHTLPSVRLRCTDCTDGKGLAANCSDNPNPT